MDITNRAIRIIKTGMLVILKNSLNWTLKYSIDTETQGWTGEIRCPKNILIYIMENTRTEIVPNVIKYTGSSIEAGNSTLPVAIPRTNPTPIQSSVFERLNDAINSVAPDALMMLIKTNIPIIIKLKFHGFIS